MGKEEGNREWLLVSFLISILLFILILPEFLHYSDYIRDITTNNNLDITTSCFNVILLSMLI